MSDRDWREKVSDDAAPLGFQQAAELPATTGDGESWTHSGCGGTVVFDLSGGFCTRCHAENLDHEIGEVVRDTEPLTSETAEPAVPFHFPELVEGVRYVPATEATLTLILDRLFSAATLDWVDEGGAKKDGVRVIAIYLDDAEAAIREALGIEAKQR